MSVQLAQRKYPIVGSRKYSEREGLGIAQYLKVDRRFWPTCSMYGRSLARRLDPFKRYTILIESF